MPRNVRSHLNPRYKPVFVSFRPSQPPPRFHPLLFVSPTDGLSPFLFLSFLFRAFYLLLYRLRRGPSVLLCGFFLERAIVELAHHYIAAPFCSLPFAPLTSLCLDCAASVLHREHSNCAILFGHDNTLLRKLIILVVGEASV